MPSSPLLEIGFSAKERSWHCKAKFYYAHYGSWAAFGFMNQTQGRELLEAYKLLENNFREAIKLNEDFI